MEIHVHQATNDSEETTKITTASSQLDAESAEPRSAARQQQAQFQAQQRPQISGHHDPEQRTIYLAVFGFSLASALVGLLLMFIWVFRLLPNPGVGLQSADKLSNLHPLLMYTFMVSLNMYAVLVYRTHYCARKELLKWTHAILAGLNMVASLLGVLAMYKAHLMAGIPNFYSLHSWIGVLTNTFFVTQFIGGFVAFLKPGLAQHKRAALMPWHRAAGTTTLVLAACAALTGIVEWTIFKHRDTYSSFAPITFVANFAGVAVILMTIGTVWLLLSPQYRRPPLAEEQPLKR